MIEVILKCRCTDGEVKLQVRERAEGEDILVWMEHVTARVGAWHSIRLCSETKLEYMKIPLAGRPDAGIGEK